MQSKNIYFLNTGSLPVQPGRHSAQNTELFRESFTQTEDEMLNTGETNIMHMTCAVWF